MALQSVGYSMSENALGKADSSNSEANKDSSVCPTCDQEYKSPKGMRQHHKRTHGESIAKITLDCSRCGKSHQRWRSQLDGEPYFCSQECRIEVLNENQDPDYNRKTVACAWCGDDVTKPVSRVERAERLHCSRECADNTHSKRLSGDGNPKWVGGYDSYYGENWQEQRKKARDRDNYTCRRCGATESELGRELSVHHKTPFRLFDNAEEANKIENLICLCKSCHGIVEAWPVQPL